MRLGIAVAGGAALVFAWYAATRAQWPPPGSSRGWTGEGFDYGDRVTIEAWKGAVALTLFVAIPCAIWTASAIVLGRKRRYIPLVAVFVGLAACGCAAVAALISMLTGPDGHPIGWARPVFMGFVLVSGAAACCLWYSNRRQRARAAAELAAINAQIATHQGDVVLEELAVPPPLQPQTHARAPGDAVDDAKV
jgi:hypothetical protein